MGQLPSEFQLWGSGSLPMNQAGFVNSTHLVLTSQVKTIPVLSCRQVCCGSVEVSKALLIYIRGKPGPVDSVVRSNELPKHQLPMEWVRPAAQSGGSEKVRRPGGRKCALKLGRCTDSMTMQCCTTGPNCDRRTQVSDTIGINSKNINFGL